MYIQMEIRKCRLTDKLTEDNENKRQRIIDIMYDTI